MKLTIHRGAREIGGSCVVLRADDGTRLVLDLGLPLDGETAERPFIDGLYADDDADIAGVIVSHAHQDHSGFVGHVHPDIPIYASAGTIALLEVNALFRGQALPGTQPRRLQPGRPVDIGPFRVTGYLVDHSAPDALAILVEANGQRVFYSGDLRAHGRKGKLFERLLANPPPHLNAMLMEGTLVGQEPRGQASEDAVDKEFARLFRDQTNMAFVFASPQNLDRIVSVYRAALQTGKLLVLDTYSAFVLDRLRCVSDRLPGLGADSVRVVVWQQDKGRLQRAGHGNFLAACQRYRILNAELAARHAEVVMLARTRLFTKVLDRLQTTAGVRFLWSMWSGYLSESSPAAACARQYRIPIHHVHCSGHATVADLRRLVTALQPGQLIPLHTEFPESFRQFAAPLCLPKDGEEVALPTSCRQHNKDRQTCP